MYASPVASLLLGTDQGNISETGRRAMEKILTFPLVLTFFCLLPSSMYNLHSKIFVTYTPLAIIDSLT